MNKTKKIFTLCVVFVVVLVVAAFAYDSLHTPSVSARRAIDTYATTESVAELSDIINAFSFRIYRQMSSNPNTNEFISPYSIFVALAMTYEGARGETAQQMQAVLGIPQNDTTVLCSFGKIYNFLNFQDQYILSTANAVWKKPGYPFFASYLNFIENYYMGEATDCDFTHPAHAAEQINQWVEDQTNNKIQDLIKASDIDPALTVMILTNAIYFKGDWMQQFDTQDTTERNFTISTGDVVKTPMMRLEDKQFNYTETDDAQVLELPYSGDDVSMIVILPKHGHNLTTIEDTIDTTLLRSWTQNWRQTSVDLLLPKYKLETEYSLASHLSDMGMPVAFTEQADFSGMTDYQRLLIQKVVHKAYIDVNEEGTEAAAATGVIIGVTSVGPGALEFHADHPFLFFLYHKETGMILFMGRLTNPVA